METFCQSIKKWVFRRERPEKMMEVGSVKHIQLSRTTINNGKDHTGILSSLLMIKSHQKGVTASFPFILMVKLIWGGKGALV